MLLEPGVCGGTIVVLDVGVILVGGKMGGDVRYALCQPPGMGDGEKILQPVPQADGSTDIGEVEPSGAIESAVVRTAGRNRRREPDPFIMMIGKPEPGPEFRLRGPCRRP